MSGYLIDSNILIVSNRNYRRDYFPVVWKFFKNNTDVYVIDRVYDEIMKLDDDLCKWTKDTYKTKILDVGTAILEYKKVIGFVTKSQNWTQVGYESWTNDVDKADPWLIAYALKNDLTIITDENMKSPNGRASDNEPKIPYVAQQLGVKTINFWEFMEKEHFKA